MARNASISITFPKKKILFTGTTTRVHPRGHLWLVNDSSPVTITLTIGTAGYTFDDGGAGDPTQAFFTGSSPNPNGYSDCNGEFSGLALSAGNTVLTFTSQNSNANKYFYQLNFLDPNGNSVSTTDPIIVNRLV